MLRIFEGIGATPGRFVPLTTLFLNWAPSLGNAAFADAVEGLARDGYLVAGERGTQYALTEAGYAVRHAR